MLCPKCKSDTAVIDSRPFENVIRRRRKCKNCDYRFTTYETINSLLDKEKMIERNIKQLEKVGELIKHLRVQPELMEQKEDD